MKKILFFLLLVAAMPAMAQQKVFGYVSYEAALKWMPEYASYESDMQQLREKYAAEQQRVESDFNKKYEEFLDGQAGFPQTILQKRQSELQEMLDKNIAFKKESQRLLCEADCEALAPLKEKLDGVLAKIGAERGYVLIVNTDTKAAAWLNESLGEDISEVVKAALVGE